MEWLSTQAGRGLRRDQSPAQVKTSDVDADLVSRTRIWVLGVLLAVVASVLVARASQLGLDYLAPSCVTTVCDDAGASIDALSEGDLHGFFANQPPMGSFSLLVRTPPAIVSNALGGDDLAVYRSGVFICVLAAGLLAVFLAASMIRAGRPWTVWALLAAACLINPLTYQAAYWGHPEEVLGAVLAVGAVIAAGRRHWLVAGLMLGAAIATKQWAALAAIPVLIAAPGGTRVRLALTCAALAAALTVPMLAADPARFHAAQNNVSLKSSYTNTVTATNAWWAFASESFGEGLDVYGHKKEIAQFSLPDSVGRGLHMGVIGVAALLSLVYARRRRDAGWNPDDVLQLLALLFLLRCMLDPLTFSYHHTPFLIALISFEALRRRVPVLSAYSIGALLVMNEVVVPAGEPALTNLFYLAWTIPLAAVMALPLSGRTAARSLGALGGDRSGRGTLAPSLLHSAARRRSAG
jgi:Glycosyltransferase family 87